MNDTLIIHTPTMSKDIYNELLCGLDELDFATGKTTKTANARAWLINAIKTPVHGVPNFTPAPVGKEGARG